MEQRLRDRVCETETAFSLDRDWVSDGYLAIDQGPIVVMIENHRSDQLWDLFMSCPEARQGLGRLGFTSPHLTRE